jgi:hypothetical protein
VSCQLDGRQHVGHFSMLVSVELKKRENHDDLDFLQMNGYVPSGIPHMWKTLQVVSAL